MVDPRRRMDPRTAGRCGIHRPIGDAAPSLTRGEPADTVGRLTEAARVHDDLGLVEPGWLRLHGDWIEALLGAGDP